MIHIHQLFRYPLKAHGREELKDVTLIAGQTMPWDRVWAVAHEASKLSSNGWASCRNFTRGASAPQLCAITSTLDEERATLTLHHPQRPTLTFDPDTDAAAFIDWVAPLMPTGRARPIKIVKHQGHGFTDSHFASVSLCNLASHRAVEAQLGRPLSPHRWRSNIWFDGGAAWVEHDWIGKEIRIGTSILRIVEAAERCTMTSANPETGQSDEYVLGALAAFDHQNFSVLAEVITDGRMAQNDPIEVI